MRNSGANAVVEGTGDHGCEYMTRESSINTAIQHSVSRSDVVEGISHGGSETLVRLQRQT